MRANRRLPCRDGAIPNRSSPATASTARRSCCPAATGCRRRTRAPRRAATCSRRTSSAFDQQAGCGHRATAPPPKAVPELVVTAVGRERAAADREIGTGRAEAHGAAGIDRMVVDERALDDLAHAAVDGATGVGEVRLEARAVHARQLRLRDRQRATGLAGRRSWRSSARCSNGTATRRCRAARSLSTTWVAIAPPRPPAWSRGCR